MTPTTDSRTDPWPSLRDAALDFAQASHRWHALGAEQERWTDPARQRELADAFLRYHAAKLAHEAARAS